MEGMKDRPVLINFFFLFLFKKDHQEVASGERAVPSSDTSTPFSLCLALLTGE